MWKASKYHRALIFGDSWGRGAWTTPDGSFIDNGDNYFSEKLLEYFSEIENFSQGGVSNEFILESLRGVLESYTVKSFRKPKTCILVIQTEPMRSVISKINHNTANFSHIFKNGNYKEFNKTLIDLFYYNLNEIGKTYKTKINLIGGCSDIDLSLTKQYPYLNVLCESFYNLLRDPSYKSSIFSATYDYEKSIPTYSQDNSAVITGSGQKLRLQRKFQGDVFGYDTDNHPSRKGIDLWTQQILHNLK